MIDMGMIAKVAAELRDALGEDFDGETFLDTLDGETDAMDIADWMIAKMLDAEALAEAAREQEADLAARRGRFSARADAFRGRMLTLLDAIGEKKLERPRATFSRRAGSLSVKITDESAIPTQLKTIKTTEAPDRAAIKAMIEAGEAVPGAELSRGPDGVTVRVK